MIEVGDTVLIVSPGPYETSAIEVPPFGVVMSKIDESWFRVSSLYKTCLGERTSVQDYPLSILEKVTK